MTKIFKSAFSTGFSQFNSKDMINKCRAFYPEFNGMYHPVDFSMFMYHLVVSLVPTVMKVTESSLIATAYNFIGLIYESRNDYQKALDYYKKSLAM